MPADSTKPADANPNEAVKPAPAVPEGTMLGEIDGVLHVMGADGKARPLDAPRLEPEDSLASWHAAFTKQRDVEIVTPGYRSSTGQIMPEVKAIVPYTSIRCVVAHRALHALSPKDRATLVAGLKGDDREVHVQLLKLFADSELMTKGGKDHPAVPHWEAATEAMKAEHADPKRLARHHAELVKSVAPKS